MASWYEKCPGMTSGHLALLKQHYEQTVEPMNKQALEDWVGKVDAAIAAKQTLPPPITFMPKVDPLGRGGAPKTKIVDASYDVGSYGKGGSGKGGYGKGGYGKGGYNDEWGGGAWNESAQAGWGASGNQGWEDSGAGAYEYTAPQPKPCPKCKMVPDAELPFCSMDGKLHDGDATESPFEAGSRGRYLVLTTTGEVIEGLSRNRQLADPSRRGEVLGYFTVQKAAEAVVEEDW